MKILILGNGYVGSNLYRYLLDKHNVTLFGRRDMDYHNMSTVSSCLKSCNPDLVVGCFGFTGRPNIDQAELKKEECWNLNVQVPLMINTVCAEMKVSYTNISTGCLFNGYEKSWTEDDIPNFGLFNDPSFYTKSKHAFELSSSHLPNTNLRIRLPFSSEMTERNLIYKLLNYDNLINYRNSKTCMEDLCSAIGKMVDSGALKETTGAYHMVNPTPLTTAEFISELRSYGFDNPKWNFVEITELGLGAPRANICMSTIRSENPMKDSPSELDALRKCLSIMKQNWRSYERNKA